MTISRRSKYLIAAVLAAVLSVPGYVLVVTKGDNFHVITEGEAYRSAQLSGGRLSSYIKKHGIRSVLNLRDAHPGEAWYDNEVAACEALGVKHYDVRMRSYQRPKDWQVDALMEVFATAPRPVLIHCQAGADRTGLASAMWRVAVDKEPKDAAKGQLSLSYGHLPFGRATAVDRYFEEWQPGDLGKRSADRKPRAIGRKLEAAGATK